MGIRIWSAKSCRLSFHARERLVELDGDDEEMEAAELVVLDGVDLLWEQQVAGPAKQERVASVNAIPRWISRVIACLPPHQCGTNRSSGVNLLLDGGTRRCSGAQLAL